MKSFKPNARPTVGVEEEFAIVDGRTGRLVPGVDRLREPLDDDLRTSTCYELKQCIVENRTGPCASVDELAEKLRAGRRRIDEAAREVGLRIVAVGAHPTDSLRDHPFCEDDHYRWVARIHRTIADNLMSLGLHVHVGMRTVESLLYVNNAMRRWIAPLIALAGNSPFLDGRDTGLASARQLRLGQMPRTHFPPRLADFAALEKHVELMTRAEDITRPGDLYWNVRPHVPLGTVEMRACDLPTDPSRIAALVAVTQGLAVHYQNACLAGRPETPLHEDYLEHTRWKAMRFGLEGKIVDPATLGVVGMRDYAGTMIDLAATEAEALGTQAHLARAREMVELPTEADRQRRLLKELGGDYSALVLLLADETVR